MENKKIISLIISFSMVVFAFAGISGPKVNINAAVESHFPGTTGLYISEYFDWENGRVKTDTDAAGNVILTNGNNEHIRYIDQDNPEYLTRGIKEGWGLGIDNDDQKWIDYIADGKVTHVKASDIKITNLDGTPCENITVSEGVDDSRLIAFHINNMEGTSKKVIITYKGADKNNAFIVEFALRSGFYSSQTLSLDSQLKNEIFVVNGRSKDVYFHLTDSWEDAGFELDTQNALSLNYFDNDIMEDIEVTGEDVMDYLSITPVSEDNPNHLIYKLSFTGKNSDFGNGFNLRVAYTRFNIQDSNDPGFEDDRRIRISFVDANSLLSSEIDDLTVRGGRYVYPENTRYSSERYYSAGNLSANLYLQFKYVEDDGNLKDIDDPSKLTVYLNEYDDENDMEVYTKTDSSVIKIEKIYEDSNIMKISYLGKPEDFLTFVITYNNSAPYEENYRNICIGFSPAYLAEINTYKSVAISDGNFANEFKTDGTNDINIYVASLDVSDKIFWNTVQSVELMSVELFDENGNNLSDKVKTEKMSISKVNGRNIIYGEKITIPKGIIKCSAKMRTVFNIKSIGGDQMEHMFSNTIYSYIFYSEPVIQPTTIPVQNEETPAPTEEISVATPSEITINPVPENHISIADATVTGIEQTYTYIGETIKPVPVLQLAGNTLVENTDYTIAFSDNINVGIAKMIIKGTGKYDGEKTISFEIVKAKNTLKLKVYKKTFSIKKNLRKKAKFNIGVTDAKGKVTYMLNKKAVKQKIKVTKKGKVIIPKKCKKGKYKIAVSAKGDENYLSAKKTVTVTIKK